MGTPLPLGAFSISLSVQDIAVSRDFYEKLGFEPVGGDAAQNWLILRNGKTTLGLFQGMFDGNLLTFNPGWDEQAQELAEFTDVREIESTLEQRGIQLAKGTEAGTKGPASVMLSDPDGNVILIDQHR